MGIVNKLRDLTKKAKNSAAEHKDQIQHTVEQAETITDERTKGKYHDRIAKAGAKVEAYVEKLQPDGSQQQQESEARAPTTARDAPRTSPRDPAERQTTPGSG